MQEIDTIANSGSQHNENEEDLFMQHVIDGDHELLYLDTYLKELFSKDN